MPTQKFVLGRECVFKVNGFELVSVRDVGVTSTTTEVDATGYGHWMRSAVVTHRTYQIDVEVLDPAEAATLREAELSDTPIVVTTTGGLAPLSQTFTIHDVTADEVIDDVVVARFSLKQWGHA